MKKHRGKSCRQCGLASIGDLSSKKSERHKKRLIQISNELLKQAQSARSEPEVEVPAPSVLTDLERKLVSGALLDLEAIYAGMTSAKQQVARDLVATHLGTVPRSRSARHPIR
ncbi:unnamed protein product [Phytophthora fragariaefolia]|uniref:Unnamed protein product n=1 Tax=Phytophthora fragariaefolia TaxID=1490495 RepID=A0A9W7DAI7_9STRA|nr:unnamed protein product [Phytophthora fragariaefolia]